MRSYIWLAILALAGVTYCIRVLPLTLIRRKIENRFLRSFLYYVPYVTLTVMTFPAILSATANVWSAAAGFLVALILAYYRKSLIQVSLVSCAIVFVVELFTGI